MCNKSIRKIKHYHKHENKGSGCCLSFLKERVLLVSMVVVLPPHMRANTNWYLMSKRQKNLDEPELVDVADFFATENPKAH